MRWLKQLTERQALAYFLIPGLSALLLMPTLWLENDTLWTSPYAYLTSLRSPSVWTWVANVLGLSLCGFLVNRLVNTFNIFARPNIGPSLFMIPAAAVWVSSAGLSIEIWASVLLIISLTQLLDVYKQQRVLRQCFNASFLLGCSALLIPEVLILAPVYMLALLRVRSFQWREWVWILLGAGIPLAYAVSLAFFLDLDHSISITRFSMDGTFVPSWPLIIVISLILINVILLPTIFKKMTQAGRRIDALFLILMIVQMAILAVACYWSYFNVFEGWLLLTPWLGIAVSVWLHNGKNNFFKPLLLVSYLTVASIGLLLRHGVISL